MMLFRDINKELKAFLSTPGAVLADVREPDEFLSGHIPRAVNCPLSAIQSSGLPKDRPIFLYCLRGARSRRAESILRRMGYHVRSVGGISRYRGPLER